MVKNLHILKESDFEMLVHLAKNAGDDAISKAIDAYENARIDGLCHEGAWECALQTLREQKN